MTPPAMTEMQVANDRLYVRDENSNVVAIFDVGTRLWVYQNVSRRIGDHQLLILGRGQWTGYFVNPAFLEQV